MKVLWFTNTILPCFAQTLGLAVNNQGGWMPSLVAAIRKYSDDIELHIVSEGPCGARAMVDGVSYYSIGKGRTGRGGKRPNKQFEKEASVIVKEVRPDVIHVHGTEGPYAEFSKEAFADCKLVVSLQGIISAYYYYYGNLVESDLSPYRNIIREVIKGYSEKNSRTFWKNERSSAERSLMSKADLVIGRTAWDKDWLQRLAPGKPYYEVGEVLREPFYKARKENYDIVSPSIYCGAALSYPLKNGHVILEALTSLRRDFPKIKVHFANSQSLTSRSSLINRLREGAYPRYVKALIKRLGISENVVHHPSLTADEVMQLLLDVDVFCLPSACENSPNSLGEAMLAGVPSVATYVGGVPSIMKNGVEGKLVQSGDPAAIATAIKELLKDRKMAKELADAAYRTAMERYNPEFVVKQLRGAYCTAIGL